jgi:uncharacterized phage protein (TIGR01671 family)
MREIKFRAKRLDNGEWSYGSGLLIADDFCVIDTDTEMYIDEEYDWAGNTHFFRIAGAMCDLKTLGQYTGLKDKNGKEIYEGDIIRSFDSNGEAILHCIVWEEARFVALYKGRYFSSKCFLKQDWLDEFEKEVIGNIYDYPELINKEYLV